MLGSALWSSYLRFSGASRYLNELTGYHTPGHEFTPKDLVHRLRSQLRHFSARPDALPAWKEVSQIGNEREFLDAWRQLPIVTKADLQTRFHPDRLQQIPGVSGHVLSTGGSTGEPTRFLHDQQMLTACIASRYFIRRMCGWHPGMRTICVWGSERDVGHSRSRRKRAVSWIRNEFLVDGYRLNDETADQVVKLIGTQSRVALYGFTSMLQFVAEKILEQGRPMTDGRVAAAWTGGEMLFDQQAQVFHKAFGTPLLDNYGGRELGPIACQFRNSQGLKVLRPHIYLEIVDDENRPVAPGEAGRLLCTSTICQGTPFLRYEVGDLASYAPEGCDESGIHTLAQLQGRTAGLLRLPDGSSLNCLYWNHLFKDYPEVRQFQVAVQPENRLVLRLVGTQWEAARDQQVLALVRKTLPASQVRIDWVDQIPRTAQGKLMQMVREAA